MESGASTQTLMMLMLLMPTLKGRFLLLVMILEWSNYTNSHHWRKVSRKHAGMSGSLPTFINHHFSSYIQLFKLSMLTIQLLFITVYKLFIFFCVFNTWNAWCPLIFKLPVFFICCSCWFCAFSIIHFFIMFYPL